MSAVTDRLAVDYPVLRPDLSRDLSKELGLLQSVTELGPKQHRQRAYREQEIITSRSPGSIIGSQATARDHVVNMRMVDQSTRPGVEHTDHAQSAAHEA